MSTQSNNVRFENVRTIAEQARTWGAKKVYPVTSNKDGVVKTFEDGTPKMFLTDGISGHTVAISKSICMLIHSKSALPQVAIADVVGVDETTGEEVTVPTLYELKSNMAFAHEDYAMEF
jgi:hypothetical protein